MFAVEDPAFTANRLYTQVLGSMHLSRRLGVREAAPGVAETLRGLSGGAALAVIQDALPRGDNSRCDARLDVAHRLRRDPREHLAGSTDEMRAFGAVITRKTRPGARSRQPPPPT